MKKILVPTDFSAEADFALEVARDIALKAGASIDFVHVIEPIGDANLSSAALNSDMPDSGEDTFFMIKLMERAKKEVERRANKSEFMEVQTKGDVKFGNIYAEIKEYAEANAVDLIVMGSKGVTQGFADIFVGSNAERVVRSSDVPVLVVKHKEEVFKAENIVFATNAEETSDAVAAKVKEVQSLFNAHVHILNVNTPINFYRTRTMKKQLEEFAQKHGFSNYTTHVYSDANEEEGILFFADDIKADLIVIGTHSRGAFSRLLSGSVSEDVLNHSPRPVLTYKIK